MDRHNTCSLQVGCDEYGVCYASAMGRPDMCGRKGDRAPADYRIVSCDACGSEGRILQSASGHANDPYDRDCGPCPCCKGTGSEIIEVEPITLEDLA